MIRHLPFDRLSFDQLTYFGHAPASWYLAEALICGAAWCLTMMVVRAGCQAPKKNR